MKAIVANIYPGPYSIIIPLKPLNAHYLRDAYRISLEHNIPTVALCKGQVDGKCLQGKEADVVDLDSVGTDNDIDVIVEGKVLEIHVDLYGQCFKSKLLEVNDEVIALFAV